MVTPQEPSLWESVREVIQLAGAGIALLFAIWQIVKAAMYNPLWPGREGWGNGWARWGATAPTLPQGTPYHGDIQNIDANRAWRGGAGVRWSTMRAMLTTDFYHLSLGKARVVSKIRVEHRIYGTPRKWGSSYQSRAGDEWTAIEEHEGPIVVEFSPPVDINSLRFTVIEPNFDEDGVTIPAWSIYDIEVTEVRLFRRWWKAIIR